LVETEDQLRRRVERLRSFYPLDHLAESGGPKPTKIEPSYISPPLGHLRSEHEH
jgi:hypothetical protein